MHRKSNRSVTVNLVERTIRKSTTVPFLHNQSNTAAALLSERRVLAQARGYPFRLLSIELAQQRTGAGTTFLRWRKHDRSAMGVALWQEVMASTATPVNLLEDLLALEQQRIALNMQISLLHTLGRQAQDCAGKMAQAEDAYLRRLKSIPAAMHDR